MRIKWHRLLTNPTTHVESQEGEVTRLRIDGLVCSSVCAVRSRQALLRIDGVRHVDVDFETGVAVMEGRPHGAAAYEGAVTGVVAGKPLRRALERVSRLVVASRRSGREARA